ncbi:IS5 family transposase [Kribbella sp. NPDC049174]|uniref:IS5 family transposase n=1 Tax=Kribbella sp. NPDC049174 TaxID=3364112 RepID=UPI00371AD088
MSRDVVSDKAWAVIGPLFPAPKATGRPPVDRRTVVEATAWRFRTGAPWRDLPERFGNWNTIYKNFDRWSKTGVWARARAGPGDGPPGRRHRLDRVDRLHDRARPPARCAPPSDTGAGANYKKFGDEPADHAIGRSRGGLTTKTHLLADGKGRALAFILTGGQVADTTMLPATLDEIRVTGASGRPRQRTDRLLADTQGLPLEDEPGMAARARRRRADPGT